MGNNGSRCVMVGEGAGSKGMAINGLKSENGGEGGRIGIHYECRHLDGIKSQWNT
jgi:hypothetical protein